MLIAQAREEEARRIKQASASSVKASALSSWEDRVRFDGSGVITLSLCVFHSGHYA